MKALAFLLAALLPAAALAADPVYRIGAGDRLSVTVLEDPNLNAQVLVRPDGRITLPIAGSVAVLGKSTEQLQAILRDRLAASFAVPPTVSVALTALAPEEPPEPEEPEEPKKYGVVFVLGEVKKPGRISLETPFEAPVTVLQALADAGGLDRFARGEAIQVRRRDAATGEETVFPFNYDALEEGGTLSGNIPLQDGDVVFVPERGLFD